MEGEAREEYGVDNQLAETVDEVVFYKQKQWRNNTCFVDRNVDSQYYLHKTQNISLFDIL